MVMDRYSEKGSLPPLFPGLALGSKGPKTFQGPEINTIKELMFQNSQRLHFFMTRV